jgi:hypothetical protein
LFKFVPDKFVFVKILPLKAQVLWYGAVFYGKVAIGFVNTTPDNVTIRRYELLQGAELVVEVVVDLSTPSMID